MLKKQVNSFFVIISYCVFTTTVTTFIIEWYITTFHSAIFTPSKNTMYILTFKFFFPSTTANISLTRCGGCCFF